MKELIKKWLGIPEQKIYIKHGRSKPVTDISSTTAYQRGIMRGKKLELKRIISVLERDAENEHIIFGNPPKMENIIGYLKFFLAD